MNNPTSSRGNAVRPDRHKELLSSAALWAAVCPSPLRLPFSLQTELPHTPACGAHAFNQTPKQTLSVTQRRPGGGKRGQRAYAA